VVGSGKTAAPALEMQKNGLTLASRIPDPTVPRARLVLRLFAEASGGTVLHEQETYLDNTASWAWQQLSIGKLATVDCWAEVYVENLAGVPVWFDDLEIATGALPVAIVVQETHYDPWGLELAGIGYNASGNPESDFKFQGKELAGDFGLGWYDFQWRQYDPVLGRANAVDPHAESYHPMSPYSFLGNNPARMVDPDGRDIYVYELVNNGGRLNREGLYALFNILSDLSELTGNNIGYKNGHIVNNGRREGANGNADAANYLDALINSDQPISVANNNAVDTDGEANGTININTRQLDGFVHGLEGAGLDGRLGGYGVAFLHESLHTRTGTEAYLGVVGRLGELPGRNGDAFADVTAGSPVTGEAVDITNSFTQNIWGTRDSYNSTVAQGVPGAMMPFTGTDGQTRQVNVASVPSSTWVMNRRINALNNFITPNKGSFNIRKR
jgi:RHS repeat-associated protein